MNLEILEARELFAVTNMILAENALPGNPQAEWDVQGAGDPTIQGFATDISVDQGQTISFKVNNPTLAPYHVDIYRVGYYNGAGARKVHTIPSSQAVRTAQPAPLFNASTRLVDAGNWSVSASWSVPTTAVSGLYLGRLVREDTGGASHMYFVVRDDDGGSDMLFQTSDTTWHAYNNWGGYSTYDYNSTGGMRAYAVSYNRPIVSRGAGSVSGNPFWAEVPMIRWLESNGYNVSYTSAVDTARRGQELLEHKVFLSVGHDEYWSREQRDSVEAARDAGVHLGFFTGNTMYWKVRWENSISSSGTPYRTMVTYKESTVRTGPQPEIPSGVSQPAYVSGIEDPSPIWTGLWRDTRFVNDAEVEQLLLGQIFSVNRGPGGYFGTAIQVPYEFSQMRLWRETSISALQPGQVATLAAGTLGYEWDEDVDNGFRPAGTINMSSTTEYVPEKLVDPISWPGCGGLPASLCAFCRGCMVAPGTATHSLTMYQAPSGALVFNTGTIQWSWGLDGVHDGGVTTPDIRMQQATVNLFADMGVSAGMLRAGLVQTTRSTDLTRPTSTITSISGNGTFTTGVPVVITGTAQDNGGGVIGGVEVSMDGGLTWRKAVGRENWSYVWTPEVTGAAVILSRAADDSGNIEIPGPGVQGSVTLGTASTQGLVAAYNFNAGSGTTLADVVGTNHGTITNATWTSGGMFGSNALSFNGTNAWVTIPDANALDLTNGLTVQAWVKPTTTSDWSTVLMKEASSGLVYALYASDDDGKPNGYLRVGSEQAATGTTSLPVGAWSHLAMTYNGSVQSLYLNGVLVGTRSATGSITTSNGALRIGGNSIWGEYFSGLIDEVRVYNRSLTQGEILADMATAIGTGIETTPPTVAMTVAAGTVSGTTTLSATATDNVALAGVQFFVNEQPVGAEITAAPFTFAWNTLLVPNGTYSVSARARDLAGNMATSAPVALTVSNAADTTAPSVSLAGLAPNSTVGGSIVLTAVATDNVGVAGVQFKINGVNLGSEVITSPYSTVWDTSALPSGSYTVTAVARDGAGNTSTSVITVTVDSTAPTVIAKSPGANAAAVPTNARPTVTFSEAINPGTLVFTLRDAGGNALASSVAYDAATRTATLTPVASLVPSAAYSLTVSEVRDLVGNVIAVPFTWAFTTTNQLTGASIWTSSATPAVTAATNDSNPQELGMKFQSSVSGFVTGVRFYKGTGNTGTHLGRLWSADGTLLASATFANESATGWQEVTFSSPVAIVANATYVVSYYAPNGHYAYSPSYFTSAVNTYPLRALSSAESGGNGLFRVGAGGGFPNQSFNSNNYWVDVVFSTTESDEVAPSIAARSPAPGATAVPASVAVTVTFSEPVQANTISFVLRDAGNNVVPATVSYNDTTWIATLTPTNALTAGATYTVTVSGVIDASGNAMSAPVAWSFTTAAVQQGSASIWDGSTVPASPAWNDSNPQELGMKFQSSVSGFVTGVRFYKGTGNTGTHLGRLWSADGTLLASATFANESATGWQEVTFSSPVAIVANATYVVSYYAPNGHYAVNTGYFGAGVTNGVLRALSSAESGGNGLFRVGAGGGFPNQSFNSNNYWVDVVFSTTAADTAPPAVASQTPSPGATGVPTTSAVTVTFTESVQANTISFVLRTASNNVVPATVSYNEATRTATLTPTNPLVTGMTYTVTVGGAGDAAGNAMSAPVSWSFQTPTPITNATLWPSSVIPTYPAWDHSEAQEVGVRFYSDVPGVISGIRFYKGEGNTGTHLGRLWSADGTLLATATFANESATGWQEVYFSQPVSISANTLYVASYYAPNGRYAVNPAYFASNTVSNGPLHAPASSANGGNGLFRVGAGGGFPNQSYNSNNFWVDVVFNQSSDDTTAPVVAATTPSNESRGVLPTASITITFSEPVQPNSLSFSVSDPYGNPVHGNLSYNTVTQTATFVPATPLLPFVTYTARVDGLLDLVGNPLAEPHVWSFTTRGIWLQTTYADFSAGTGSGTLVTDSAGGEIELAPLLHDDFNGSSLSANWSSVSWSSGGGGATSLGMIDGVLSVGGAGVFSAQSNVYTPLEGRVQFGAAAFQHFGLATGLDTVSGNYWAIFSTAWTTNQLFARVNANGVMTDVNLGALPTGFHIYRIQPTASGFEFYVDDVLQTTITASFQNSVALKATASDFQAIAGKLLQVDQVRFRSYSTTQSGTFTSTVFDAGSTVTWDSMSLTADTPEGTSLEVTVRIGNMVDGEMVWQTAQIGADGLLHDGFGNPVTGRYIQYFLLLTTTDPTKTPRLYDISFTWI